MTTTTELDILADGSLPGLTVVGFHGHMDVDETPAKLGPVYANEAGCLTRIVEVGPTQWTRSGRMRTESFPPPLRDDQPLPGEGTRIGKWKARLGNVVMAVGPEERGRITEVRRIARDHGSAAAEQFIEWFAGRERCSDELACERQGEIALWYCAERDGFSLLECVHRVVKDAFFQAVRARSSPEIEEMAWWLSRAAVDDQDIYLAAAALRWVASPAWEVLIREGLHLPDEKDWRVGLEKAAWHMERPPAVAVAEREITPVPRSDVYRHRAAVRALYLPKSRAG
jgi:hypothetical protein